MAKENKHNHFTFSDTLLLLLAGVGIGLLIGLSVSPVLHIIVASVIALAAGIVGTLAGVDRERSVTKDEAGSVNRSNSGNIPKHLVRISPLPLTALVSGLAVGSCVGIYLRTNDYLGPNPQVFTQRWSGTGLEEKHIKMRLFDQLYPQARVQGTSNEIADKSKEVQITPDTASGVVAPEDSKTPKPPSASSEVGSRERPKQLAANLYAITAEDCGLIRLKHGNELRTLLRGLGNAQVTASTDKCKDDDCLEAIKELICSAGK